MDTAQPSLQHVEGPDAAARCRAYLARELHALDDEVVANAQLVLTELVTNAQLHGEPPLLFGVTALGDGAARVEVSDAGRNRLVLPAHSVDAMTGRGLTVVAALAESWGVDPIAGGGKVVWAVLRPGSSEQVEAPDVDLDAFLAAWGCEPGEPEFTVRLGAVPTGLLLAAKRHIDNVVRELTLAAGAAASPPPAELAGLIDAVTGDFAQARTGLKEQAAAAAARGARHTDLALQLPVSCVEAGERYLAALDEVDRYARTARILTLEAPPLHQLFRRWYVTALVEQLRAWAAGRVPDEPTPFVEVLACEVDELSALRETAFRLDLLQRMNAAVTEAHTAEGLARTVIAAAVRELGAVTARVYVNTGDRLTAVGQSVAPEAGIAAYDEVALDADIPSAIVFRTGRPIVVRSLGQLGDRFPELNGIFDSERALHVVPLQVGPRRLGVLGLAFPPTSRYDEAAQTRYVRALADVLAQGLVRIETETRLHHLEGRQEDSWFAELALPLAPPDLPAVPGLEVSSVFEPFAGESGLAGDFYDLFGIGQGRWLLAIGDVVGKGAAAAAVTGLLRYTLWGAARSAPDPVAMAHALNSALVGQGADRSATLVLAVLTPGEDGLAVDAVWAGHPPAVLVRDGLAHLVHGDGLPVGMFAEVTFELVRFTLGFGETLLLYTDGLLERQDALLEERVLTELLLEHADLGVRDLLVAVTTEIAARYPARDDVAAVALRPSTSGRVSSV